ncbi:MAG TPA: hypothetical protein VL128_13425 [Candidatus Eisenbacteria bacterium]|nr:hypothetical protein [Candidatus Eisenbacteria bacterium]
MITIDPRAAEKIQPELLSGETIYWAAMPNPNKIFHSDDWSIIPFSLIWTGFFVFMEGQAFGYWTSGSKSADTDIFMALWGIPFLVFGQYIVWGRFLHDAWLKRRTFYAVTNRRVLIIQESWKPRSSFTFLEHIGEISTEGTDVGTLWLGPKLPILGGRRSPKRSMSRFDLSGRTPVLADIDNVDYVNRLIQELRPKSQKVTYKSEPNTLTYPNFG